jgi:outer membrane protein OmpA-like peptidoglycan-associated protein
MNAFLKFLLITVCIAGVSCIGAKKMREAKEKLNKIKEGQVAEVKQITEIESTVETKLDENKIDSILNLRFNTRLEKSNKEMDSVGKEIGYLDSLMTKKSDFRKSYKKIIVPKLALLDSFRKENSKRSQVYLMLEDGLNVSTYTLFDLAAFFGPGKYLIPEDKLDLATMSFSPMVDSIIKFSNKYTKIPRAATLIILGFADGTGFSEGPLFDTLTGRLGRRDVTKQELNQILSELRAEELQELLTLQFLKRTPSIEYFELLNVEYLYQGKGEEYPLRTIKDYLVDDERRRVVLCYWAVIPK